MTSRTRTVVDGKATVTLPEGRYRIAVESPGHKRKEKTLKVVARRAARRVVRPGGDRRRRWWRRKSNIWKPIFGVSLATTVVLGGISLYSFLSWHADVTSIDAHYTDPARSKEAVGDSDCDGSDIGPGVDDMNGTLKDVCSRRQLNIITGIAAGGMARGHGRHDVHGVLPQRRRKGSDGVVGAPHAYARVRDRADRHGSRGGRYGLVPLVGRIRTITFFDVGVPERSAELSSGTSALASGK